MKNAFLSTMLAGSLLVLAACADKEAEVKKAAEEADAADMIVAENAPTPTLADIVAGPTRTPEAMVRDKWRNPVETLNFFGLEPEMTVIEIWPGGGWYADIIAPYMATGGGVYVAAGFDPERASDRTLERISAFNEKYRGNPDLYGEVSISAFSGTTGPLVPEGTADMVLTFRNVHNWMGRDFADKAFTDFYNALKPGGILGVVEHRAKTDEPQDPKAGSGYVREDFVIAMAEAAGFELVEASEINANPADTADHPYGVWTLPPRSRTPREGEEGAEEFDAEKYLAIGESDRMTLKFRKPLTADGALLE